MNPNSDPVDFSNFLERISSMNGGMMNGDNEYSEEDSSEDEEDSTEDEEDSTEDEEESSEDGSTQYETDESSSENEVSEEKVSESVSSVDDNVKSESSKEPEPAVVEEVVIPKKEEPEEKPFIGIDDLIDDKALKKMPTASIKKLDLGTVMVGGDGKTKYIVALNKSGKKYWKRN